MLNLKSPIAASPCGPHGAFGFARPAKFGFARPANLGFARPGFPTPSLGSPSACSAFAFSSWLDGFARAGHSDPFPGLPSACPVFASSSRHPWLRSYRPESAWFLRVTMVPSLSEVRSRIFPFLMIGFVRTARLRTQIDPISVTLLPRPLSYFWNAGCARSNPLSILSKDRFFTRRIQGVGATPPGGGDPSVKQGRSSFPFSSSPAGDLPPAGRVFIPEGDAQSRRPSPDQTFGGLP
jgi:hypothetical protein